LHFSEATPDDLIKKEIHKIKFVSYRDYFSKDRTVYSSSSMIVINKESFYKIGMFRKHYDKKEFFLDDIDFILRAGTISPAIIIYEPYQFAYRTHAENSVKNLKRVLISLHHLIDSEYKGMFAGGDERKFERHAIIGGPSYYWLLKAVANGIIFDSIKFFFRAYPFITKGLIKKISYLFKEKLPLIEI
jgi:hypothetical protein